MRYITIATEDELSEVVAQRLVREFPSLAITQNLRRGGNGYLRSRLENFFALARHMPVLMITDLDSAACAPALLQEWCGDVKMEIPSQMLLRVAVREVEAWLLADEGVMGAFLKTNKIPKDPERLKDPKKTLLSLAQKAPKDIKDDLIAKKNSIAIQGLGYNSRLGAFVREVWCPRRAVMNADSLKRCLEKLANLA